MLRATERLSRMSAASPLSRARYSPSLTRALSSAVPNRIGFIAVFGLLIFRNGPPPSGFGALNRLSFHTKKSAKKIDELMKDEKDKKA
jgi:hypothetical protein